MKIQVSTFETFSLHVCIISSLTATDFNFSYLAIECPFWWCHPVG